MIDLHIHTVFSDGLISEISDIKKDCDLFCITDHNSLAAYDFFKNNLTNSNYIIGCEITIDRAPDHLIYFPKFSNIKEIESDLENIRLAEENVIKQCYFKLGFNNWEEDISKAYPSWQKIRNARTRDLAAIIHLHKSRLSYDGGNFDKDDLMIARAERNKFADSEGNPVSENYAFKLAKKYRGNIVLAHPIHSAIKKCRRGDTTLSSVKSKVEQLINSFALKGGTCIEWEYFDIQNADKYGLTLNALGNIKDFIFDIAKDSNLTFTIGSDSHSLDNYHNSRSWLNDNNSIILDRIAPWIKNILEKKK